MRLCVNGGTIDAFTRLLIHISDNQLILCRIFHRARLFLLPTLRLRLDFAIRFSKKRSKIFCKILLCPFNIWYYKRNNK